MSLLQRTGDGLIGARDRIFFRFLATPQDNMWSESSVEAGRILEWIDRAGYACAASWSSSYCVTAYVGNVNFSTPIPAGAIIEISAQIIHTRRTSMQVLVRVESSDLHTGQLSPAMDCILVFVAVDSSGRPRPVPAWSPSTELERRMESNAQARVAIREEIHAAMRQQSYTDQGTTPHLTFRFLASPSVANFGGKVHGGTVMRWITETAHACASEWTSASPLAIYSGGIHFYHPIAIGDVVEVDARLIHTSADTMHVATRVHSWPLSGLPGRRRTTQCLSIYVNPDEDRRRRPIKAITLISDEDRRLSLHAEELVRLRAQLAGLPKGN